MENSLENLSVKREALYSEHLKEGMKPIMACVGDFNQFRKYMPEVSSIFSNSNDFGRHNVNYYEHPKKLNDSGFISPRERSYVISPIDNKDKFSNEYYNCTGIVVAGKDKKSGEEISFMSHQDPFYFIGPKLKGRFSSFISGTKKERDQFIFDLENRILEMKERCEEGTIDAVIFGGNFIVTDSKEDRQLMKDYLLSVRLLSRKILKEIGFKPVVITGPKLRGGYENVCYINDRRKLYFIKPSVGNSGTRSYSPTELEKNKKIWKKDNESQ